MKFIKEYAGVVALIAITAFLVLGGPSKAVNALSGTTNYDSLGLLELKVGTGCNDSGTYSSCGALTVGSSGTFTQGGGVTATTSAASATFLASDFDTENGIEISLSVGAVTLTLPASTTFPLGTTAGSYREFTMFNASTTGGAIITIAGGTGTLLEVASSTASAGLKTIAPSGAAVFTAWRKANSDIEVFMNPGQ